MYEDNENKIDWKKIVKKIVIVIVVIIAILGITSLVKKCSHKADEPKQPTTVDLSKQLDELEEATLKYLTPDNLPSTINASKTIRLKILTNSELLTGITDDNGNACDINSSYAEVTKLDNNYAVKLSLTCGSNSDYRIIYVGCFADCNGSVCKGNEDSENGVCEITSNENEKPENNSTNTNTDSSNNSTSNTKPTTNTNTNTNSSSKPNTGSSSKPNTGSNNKPSSGNNGNSGTNNNLKPVTYVTLYEYKRYITKMGCNVGSPVNGICERSTPYTAYGKVVTHGGETYTKILGDATPKTITTPEKTNTVDAKYAGIYSTTKPATAKNTNTVRYLFKNYSNGRYNYKKYTCSTGTIKSINGVYKCQTTTPGKTETTYSCSVGNVQVINGVHKCVTTEKTPITYGCEDKSYTYNKNNNTCTKKDYKIEHFSMVPIPNNNYETMWSKAISVFGWSRTGRSKVVAE